MKIHTLPVGANQTNCYIVSDDNKHCAVIDPGDEFAKIKGALIALSLAPKAILLTHAHFDHIGALDSLAEEYNIPIYCHTEEKSVLTDPEKNLTAFFAEKGYVCPHKLTLLEDGEFVCVGKNIFRTVFTPGHTEGSVCFLFGNKLFSGDTLFKNSIGRTDFPGGDFEIISDSLRKLSLLPEECEIFPGHGESSSIGIEKKYNPYMQRI